MAEWEKEIAELKTDVKYIREDVNIMQKQIRDLNKHTNMGLGGIKVLLIVGAVVGAARPEPDSGRGLLLRSSWYRNSEVLGRPRAGL